MFNSQYMRVYPSGQLDYKVTEHFKSYEFDCPVESPYTFIHPDLVNALEQVRLRSGIPIAITSGYRTPEYNSDIGGHIHSYHQAGMAADWTFGSIGSTVNRFLELLGMDKIDESKFFPYLGGIGLYEDRNFVHFDVQPRIDGKVKVWHG